MRLTNSARQEAGLFQNIQTVPLCWNGAESLVAVAAWLVCLMLAEMGIMLFYC
jgi:hypothetical protein